MKKKTQKLGVIFGIILLTTIMSGCTQQTDDADNFIGTWITEIKTNPMSGSNYTETRIFYANGSYITTNLEIGRIPGTWRLSNGKLIIDTYYPGTYEYSFSENNTILHLISVSGGFSENLTKQ
jgi:hypothetical protein